VLAAERAGFYSDEAVVAVTAVLSASQLDPATMLFQPELWPSASELRSCLDLLASKCDDGTLGSVSPRAVRNAQNGNVQVIGVLCAVAGLTFDELRDRVSEALPTRLEGSWTSKQVNVAFAEIDRVVRGDLEPSPPGAEAARPAELIKRIVGVDPAGWTYLEMLRIEGVPYEVLLAQRIVGGAWEKHRDRTSQRPTRAVASHLTSLLSDAGFEVLLATGYGGEAKQRDISDLVGGGGEIGCSGRSRGSHRSGGLMVRWLQQR
jgi:hypothetical protein